jgi:hypothetical protein
MAMKGGYTQDRICSAYHDYSGSLLFVLEDRSIQIMLSLTKLGDSFVESTIVSGKGFVSLINMNYINHSLRIRVHTIGTIGLLADPFYPPSCLLTCNELFHRRIDAHAFDRRLDEVVY